MFNKITIALFLVATWLSAENGAEVGAQLFAGGLDLAPIAALDGTR